MIKFESRTSGRAHLTQKDACALSLEATNLKAGSTTAAWRNAPKQMETHVLIHQGVQYYARNCTARVMNDSFVMSSVEHKETKKR